MVKLASQFTSKRKGDRVTAVKTANYHFNEVLYRRRSYVTLQITVDRDYMPRCYCISLNSDFSRGFAGKGHA